MELWVLATNATNNKLYKSFAPARGSAAKAGNPPMMQMRNRRRCWKPALRAAMEQRVIVNCASGLLDGKLSAGFAKIHAVFCY